MSVQNQGTSKSGIVVTLEVVEHVCQDSLVLFINSAIDFNSFRITLMIFLRQRTDRSVARPRPLLFLWTRLRQVSAQIHLCASAELGTPPTHLLVGRRS